MRRWYGYLIRCKAAAPEHELRGAQFAGVLLVALAVLTIQLGDVVYDEGFGPSTFASGVFLGLAGLLYLLNRRGFVVPAVWGANATILSVTIIACIAIPGDSPMFALGSLCLFIVPVVLSGTFLSPVATVLVGGCAIGAIYGTYEWGITAPTFDVLRHTQSRGFTFMLLAASLVILFIAACAYISSRIRTQAEQRLQQTNVSLREQLTHRYQLSLLLLTAQEDERARMAADLHDGPLSELTALILALDGLRQQPHTSDHKNVDLHPLRVQAHTIAQELRRLMNNLRPALLDDAGLEAALRQLAAKWQARTGAALQLAIHLEGSLDSNLEMALFRVTQEALTNIAQHAHATQAWVTLEQHPGRVQLTIRDDGQGFVWPATHHYAATLGHIGLALLMERVATLGGAVTLTTAPTQGTTIHCVFPLVTAALYMEPVVQPLPTRTRSLQEDT